MKSFLWRVAGLALVASVAGVIPVAAQSAHGTLTLPVAGTFDRGGEFTGTITINRFQQSANGSQIVAMGFVSGVLRRGSGLIGSAVAGEIAWPVTLRAGGVSLAGAGAQGTSRGGRIADIVWRPGVDGYGTVRVQATGCSVLQISLNAQDVNLMGIDVALGATSLSVTGQSGTPLGDLVCSVSDLIGNVAGIVNLLNNILGLVTGLLGGITGG